MTAALVQGEGMEFLRRCAFQLEWIPRTDAIGIEFRFPEGFYLDYEMAVNIFEEGAEITLTRTGVSAIKGTLKEGEVADCFKRVFWKKP